MARDKKKMTVGSGRTLKEDNTVINLADVTEEIRDILSEGINVTPDNGTDGTGIVQPLGGTGLRGWLSGIYGLFLAGLAKVQLNGSLPAGTDLIGKVGIDQATPSANEVVTKTGSVTAATLNAETTKVIGTVNSKVADGDNIALGAKADAPATVADATPFSVIALLKGLWNKLAGTLTVEVTGSNVELKAKTTITWDGIDATKNVELSPASGDVLIWAKNTADQELTATLEHEVEEGVFAPYMDGTGTVISFKIPASTGEGVYGVFQKFPKYLGGRIVLTAGSAPTANGTTTVQVQEV